jgi:hypothetical protein
MPIPQGFQKAQLEVEGQDTIQCLFNPTEYSMTKSNQWTFKATPGTPLPPAQFGGGNPRELTLNLMLDKSLLGPDQSVRSITDKLFKMMDPLGGGQGGAANAVPPFVTFRWGSVVTFKAVCKTLTIAFQLFQPNGEPIRADVKMTLTQAEVKKKGQNPTTRTSHPGMGVHTVKDGDSLQSIAYKAYGDATRWRSVAEANGIDNPFRLQRGTSLTLPRLDG